MGTGVEGCFTGWVWAVRGEVCVQQSVKINMKKSAPCLFVFASFLVLSRCTALAQGSLTPPGAPAPTMRTLLEIEPRTPISSLPFTISTSGGYYLAGNLTGSNGISIAADNVDLDLMGFSLCGSTGTNSGINVPASQINLTIRNGNIVNWGGMGVNAANASNGRLEGLRASSNKLGGLIIGVSSIVSRCEAFHNRWDGIRVGDGSRVRDCVARANGATVPATGGSGILGAAGVIISGCAAVQNIDSGIVVGDSSLVTGCSATMHSYSALPGAHPAGIKAGNLCTIINCNSSTNSEPHSNGNLGIRAGNGCTIKDCTTDYNSGGITAGSDCNIQGCTASRSVANGPGTGILTGAFNLISGCQASGNSYANIQVGDFCYVKDSIFIGASSAADLFTGSRNAIVHNTPGSMLFGSGGIYSFGVSNATGTIDNAVSLNSSKNPHANITP